MPDYNLIYNPNTGKMEPVYPNQPSGPTIIEEMAPDATIIEVVTPSSGGSPYIGSHTTNATEQQKQEALKSAVEQEKQAEAKKEMTAMEEKKAIVLAAQQRKPAESEAVRSEREYMRRRDEAFRAGTYGVVGEAKKIGDHYYTKDRFGAWVRVDKPFTPVDIGEVEREAAEKKFVDIESISFEDSPTKVRIFNPFTGVSEVGLEREGRWVPRSIAEEMDRLAGEAPVSIEEPLQSGEEGPIIANVPVGSDNYGRSRRADVAFLPPGTPAVYRPGYYPEDGVPARAITGQDLSTGYYSPGEGVFYIGVSLPGRSPGDVGTLDSFLGTSRFKQIVDLDRLLNLKVGSSDPLDMILGPEARAQGVGPGSVEDRAAAYDRALEDYNKIVDEVNARGGADAATYNRLEKQRAALEKERASIEADYYKEYGGVSFSKANERDFLLTITTPGGQKATVEDISAGVFRWGGWLNDVLNEKLVAPVESWARGHYKNDPTLPIGEALLEFGASLPGGVMQGVAAIPLAVEMGISNKDALVEVFGRGVNLSARAQVEGFKTDPLKTLTSDVLFVGTAALGAKGSARAVKSGARKGLGVLGGEIELKTPGELAVSKFLEVKGRNSGYVYKYPEKAGAFKAPTGDEFFVRPSGKSMVDASLKSSKIKPLSARDYQVMKMPGDVEITGKGAKARDIYQYREPTALEDVARPKISEEQFLERHTGGAADALEFDKGVTVIRLKGKKYANLDEMRTGFEKYTPERYLSGLPVEDLLKPVARRAYKMDVLRPTKSSFSDLGMLGVFAGSGSLGELDLDTIVNPVTFTGTRQKQKQKHRQREDLVTSLITAQDRDVMPGVLTSTRQAQDTDQLITVITGLKSGQKQLSGQKQAYKSTMRMLEKAAPTDIIPKKIMKPIKIPLGDDTKRHGKGKKKFASGGIKWKNPDWFDKDIMGRGSGL